MIGEKSVDIDGVRRRVNCGIVFCCQVKEFGVIVETVGVPCRNRQETLQVRYDIAFSAGYFGESDSNL